jgi:putative membrane protein
MNDSSASGGHRDQLAERRTETAFHRTLLAEQRTYSAWVRTGLASAATGFAIAKLLTDVQPLWLVRGLAVVFILAGAAMFLLAFWAYRSALTKLDSLPTGGVPLWILAVLSFALFGASAAGLLLLFR